MLYEWFISYVIFKATTGISYPFNDTVAIKHGNYLSEKLIEEIKAQLAEKHSKHKNDYSNDFRNIYGDTGDRIVITFLQKIEE